MQSVEPSFLEEGENYDTSAWVFLSGATTKVELMLFGDVVDETEVTETWVLLTGL